MAIIACPHDLDQFYKIKKISLYEDVLIDWTQKNQPKMAVFFISLVEIGGIEPPASALRTQRSPS